MTDLNYPFLIALFFITAVMLTGLYVTREDKETPFLEQARWFFFNSPPRKSKTRPRSRPLARAKSRVSGAKKTVARVA